MLKDGLVKSTCAICFAGCGVLAHLRDGKVVEVEGDPDAPLNKGLLCSKGYASVEYVYHPDRLMHPLRRAGERGQGRWEQISWNEALTTIAERMNSAKAEHGAESVLFLRGSAKGLQDNVFTRLVNAFGSPNITSMAYVCFHPRVSALNLTFGSFLVPDYDYPPACFVVWGSNPEATCVPIHRQIAEAQRKGTGLIVIDPRESHLARQADIWIRPRPGSDLVLALGLINVVISEGLFDADFVNAWTVGFEELRKHVEEYPLERVEEITRVPVETIRRAARLYAKQKPAAMQVGNALEQTSHAMQTQRAIFILQSIMGNIGVPGGEIEWSNPPLISRGSPTFTLQDHISPEVRARRLGAERLGPIAKYALPQSIVSAILTGEPYRPRAAYIQGGNLLTTWTNAQETLEALKRLDFIAVADMFMTPTAEMSDIVLPVATYLEFDGISHSPEFFYIAQIQQKAVELGECWSDTRILIELSKKLGLGEHFWKDEYELAEELLKPAGLSFSEFRKLGSISGLKKYRHYQSGGFKTPSGKVELYSENLKQWGFDPLPAFHGLPGDSPSDPCLSEYPFVLTNWKPGMFRHSNLRQVAGLRTLRPDPIVELHAETAKRLGIADGDWVFIETKRGRIKQKARLVGSIDPAVVIIDHGWWYPERGVEDLHGWTTSNANVLTDNKPPYSPEMGTPILRGIACRVYKA